MAFAELIRTESAVCMSNRDAVFGALRWMALPVGGHSSVHHDSVVVSVKTIPSRGNKPRRNAIVRSLLRCLVP